MSFRPIPARSLPAVTASCALALVAASFVASPAVAAPDSATTASFGGHDYRTFDELVSWHEAVAACEQDAGHLVTISSDEENAFVYDLNPYTWLGATDEQVEGVWAWVTGEPFDYTNWAPGEPNNSSNPGELPEHWLGYWGDPYVGQWNDLPDEVTKSFVCEYESPGAARLSEIRDLVAGFDLGLRDSRRLLRWVDLAGRQLDRGRPAAACVAAQVVVLGAKRLARQGELTSGQVRELRWTIRQFCHEILG